MAPTPDTRPHAGSVVVGYDGSPHADHAVDWAADQAAAEARALTVVNAIGSLGTPGTVWLDSSTAEPAGDLELMHEDARALLSKALDRIVVRHPDLAVRPVVADTDATHALLAQAEDASVLVVGSRGRGPIRSRLLGSVSLAVAERAPCPVVVVRPFNRGDVRRGVLVGMDGTPSSRPVVEHAFLQASLRRLPLTVLHALWDPMTVAMAPSLLLAEGDEATDARLLVAEAISGLPEKYPDVHVETMVARGHPAASLLDLAQRMDLTVVGCHQRHGVRRLLEGSVTAEVVEHVAGVVAVVPVPVNVPA